MSSGRGPSTGSDHCSDLDLGRLRFKRRTDVAITEQADETKAER